MAYYDNYSNRGNPTFVGKFISKNMVSRVLQEIERAVPARGTVLEIGGGKGEFAAAVTASGWKYVGIEPNTKLVEKLKEYGQIFQGMVPPFNIPGGQKFDVIYSSNVIEHMSKEMAFDYLQEAAGYLNTDGALVTIAPNYLDLKEFFWDCDYTHKFPVTVNRMQQILGDAGFKIEKILKMRSGFTGAPKLFVGLAHIFLGAGMKLGLNRFNMLYKLYLSTCEQIAVYARVG